MSESPKLTSAQLNDKIIYARGWNDAVRAAAKTARFHSVEEPAISTAKIIAVNIEKLDLSMQACEP